MEVAQEEEEGGCLTNVLELEANCQYSVAEEGEWCSKCRQPVDEYAISSMFRFYAAHGKQAC